MQTGTKPRLWPIATMMHREPAILSVWMPFRFSAFSALASEELKRMFKAFEWAEPINPIPLSLIFSPSLSGGKPQFSD